eukprot:TRINITY_DN3611_c0_g1_i1.p2 TRINITY_DN3611_c0_g1~~TRINITY_DN3611_c0_g1_i1.p2  ORF type:complete len:573 (+),score=205.31 TRINITY_DN3611_c0_g1_i1:112-1719(+)
MASYSLLGRSMSVVQDLSREEQLFLYHQTRNLKEAVRTGSDVSAFRIENPAKAVYLIFMEDSTRTKESFRNAASFHGCKVNVFDAATSSFNKKESITDTVKMLCGYSTEQSLFVVRSKLEGTCTWLAQAITPYCEKLGVPAASFINAGDGRHEHPTQEFLDEFSFLEQKGWDLSSIHLALVGDLYHGRTVHSKVDGLCIYEKVKVDLIAPDDIALPAAYEQRMRANGFEVRRFESIEEYLKQDDVAALWYFTRLQLERMGDRILGREAMLRRSVTFRQEFMDLVPKHAKFYHPLPRHQKHPVIPTFLDHTSFNAWDSQSVNGYYTRIIELAMCAGALELSSAAPVPKQLADDVEEYVQEVPREGGRGKKDVSDMKVGIKPVSNGVVIDHIGRDADVSACWRTIFKIHKVLGFGSRYGSCGVFPSSSRGGYKGLVSLPDLPAGHFDSANLKRLAAIAPESTLNIVEDCTVTKKFRLHMPPRVYGFDDVNCPNAACISNKANHENATVSFTRADAESMIFRCVYCEHSCHYEDIWVI